MLNSGKSNKDTLKIRAHTHTKTWNCKRYLGAEES